MEWQMRRPETETEILTSPHGQWLHSPSKGNASHGDHEVWPWTSDKCFSHWLQTTPPKLNLSMPYYDYRAELVSMATEGLHGNVEYYSSNSKWSSHTFFLVVYYSQGGSLYVVYFILPTAWAILWYHLYQSHDQPFKSPVPEWVCLSEEVPAYKAIPTLLHCIRLLHCCCS